MIKFGKIVKNKSAINVKFSEVTQHYILAKWHNSSLFIVDTWSYLKSLSHQSNDTELCCL